MKIIQPLFLWNHPAGCVIYYELHISHTSLPHTLELSQRFLSILLLFIFISLASNIYSINMCSIWNCSLIGLNLDSQLPTFLLYWIIFCAHIMKLQNHKIDFLYRSYITLADICMVNIHILIRVTVKIDFSGINNMLFDVLKMLIYLNNDVKGNFVLSYIFHNKCHNDPDMSLRFSIIFLWKFYSCLKGSSK